MKKTIASQKVDSLTYFFEKANNDNVPHEKRQLYTKKAITIISAEKNDSMNRVNYFKVANRYFNMNAMDNYKKITEIIILNSKKAKDSFSLAKAYSYLGDYYGSKFESEQAYKNYFYAENIYIKLKDKVKIAKTLLNKSILQFNEKDFIGSEKSAYDALKILKKTNNDALTYEANNLLGIIYHELSEFDSAIQYHNTAMLILKKQNVPSKFQSEATSLNNLGAIYQKKKNYKKALKYYYEGLKSENILIDKPILYTTLIDNIAYCEFKLKKLDSLPNLFYKSLKINDSLKYFPGIISNNLNLSEFYTYKNDLKRATYTANQAYKISKKHNLSRETLLSLKQLNLIDTPNSSKYSKEYIRINDSLQLSERKIRNKLARIEFETDELIVQKDKLVEQRQSLIYLGFAFLVVGIFIYVIRIQASKNRELLLVQEQQVANEEIYQLMLTQQEKVEEGKQLEKRRISRELHDGVMGRLSSIRLNLFVLNKKTDSETILKCLGHIDEIQNIEKEIKTIVYDLEMNVFSDTIGFISIIKNLFRNIEEHSDIHFKLNVDEKIEWEVLKRNNKINIYRILQESLQNINKYADAKNVTLRINKTENIITIAIIDDGIGFDVKKIKKGMGLKNMQERTNEMNGKISIFSEEGKGTKINLLIPI